MAIIHLPRSFWQKAFFAIWTTLYFTPVVFAMNTLNEIYKAELFTSTNVLLLSLGIGLSVYFWGFDVLNPGLKVLFPCKSLLGIIPGVFVIFGLFGLVMTVNYPMMYLLVVSILYFCKAAWHRATLYTVEGSEYRAYLRLAILSDAVIAIILVVYWFVFSHFGLEFALSHGVCWLTVGIVLSLEAHYQFLKAMVGKVFIVVQD